MLMTVMKKVVGASCGQVTLRKRAHRPAPSISAASYSSGGTLLSAARYRSMLFPPTTVQMLITISASLAPTPKNFRVNSTRSGFRPIKFDIDASQLGISTEPRPRCEKIQ